LLEETIAIAGLEGSATITVDRWGIAHIRAKSFMDMFFVQGFNAARDRLWQLDMWRKRGLGLLAADFGPGYVEQDRAARLFLYRGDMEAEWASYSDDARDICERFVAGINAYIDRCDCDPALLPPEFITLGIRPGRWAAQDVVRVRSHSLMRNAMSEVVRSNVLASEDAAIDILRQKLVPAHDPLAGRSRPEALPLDCLDVQSRAACRGPGNGSALAEGNAARRRPARSCRPGIQQLGGWRIPHRNRASDPRQ
jgi:penicillin G amidase